MCWTVCDGKTECRMNRTPILQDEFIICIWTRPSMALMHHGNDEELWP